MQEVRGSNPLGLIFCRVAAKNQSRRAEKERGEQKSRDRSPAISSPPFFSHAGFRSKLAFGRRRVTKLTIVRDSTFAFTFEKLLVYQKAIDFADEVCETTEGFPRG